MTGDVQTDPRFWDCACENYFIHAKRIRVECPICRTTEPAQPDSRVDEIGRGGLFACDECWAIAYNIVEYYDSLDEYSVKAWKKSRAIGRKVRNSIQRLRVSLHSHIPDAVTEQGEHELSVTIDRRGVCTVYRPYPSTLDTLKRVLYRVEAQDVVVQFGNADGSAYCETIYYRPVVVQND